MTPLVNIKALQWWAAYVEPKSVGDWRTIVSVTVPGPHGLTTFQKCAGVKPNWRQRYGDARHAVALGLLGHGSTHGRACRWHPHRPCLTKILLRYHDQTD